jgi:hypothetical protein
MLLVGLDRTRSSWFSELGAIHYLPMRLRASARRAGRSRNRPQTTEFDIMASVLIPRIRMHRCGRVRTSYLAGTIYILTSLVSLTLYASGTAVWSAAHIVVLALTSMAYLWVIREFFILAHLSRMFDEALCTSNCPEATQTLKQFSKTPAWLVATSIGVLLLAAGEVFF